MTTKIIGTSYRIIQMLKLLFEKPRSLEELLYLFDIQNCPIERKTVTKYFATLRKFGCIITKENNKFVLKKTPFFIELSKSDVKNLNDICLLSKEVLTKNQNNALTKIVNDICIKSNGYIENNLQNSNDIYGKYKSKIEDLSKYMYKEAPKVRILYNDEKITAKLRNFKYKEHTIYIMVFDEEKMENRLLLLDDIHKVENLSQVSSKINFAKTTIFKLKGRVAKGYTSPYKDEIITYLDDGSIIVENKYEDKEALRKRLLKYFDMCEILEPKSEREKFIEMLNDYIKKYSS